MSKILKISFYVFGGLLFISLIAAFFNPIAFPFFAFVALFFPFLWIINVCFFLYFLFSNRRLAVISAILVLAGVYELSLLLTFSLPDKNHHPTNGIQITSFNAGNQQKENAFKNRKEAFDYVSIQNPDIVCLQEFIPQHELGIEFLEGCEEKVSVTFDGVFDGKANGLSVYSKYEILEFGCLKQELENTYALWCNISVGRDTITLINVQLQSIRLAKNELAAMTKFGQMIDNPRYLFSIYSKLKRGFLWREEQVKKLKDLIDSSKYRVVLCGDFNDPPSSFAYREISKLLSDTFLKKGKYFGSTYSGGLPFLRIDYILVDKAIKVHAYEKIKQTHSDHYPIFVRISFGPD